MVYFSQILAILGSMGEYFRKSSSLEENNGSLGDNFVKKVIFGLGGMCKKIWGYSLRALKYRRSKSWRLAHTIICEFPPPPRVLGPPSLPGPSLVAPSVSNGCR